MNKKIFNTENTEEHRERPYGLLSNFLLFSAFGMVRLSVFIRENP